MQPISPRPERSAVLLLWQLALAFEARLATELASMDLTTASFRLIGEVMLASDGLRTEELARRLKVSLSTLTATVSQMVISDLLLMSPDPADPSHQLVTLSARADLLPGIEVLARIEDVLLAGLSGEDQHAAQDLLAILNQNLQPSG
ncbi:MAG: MarR family transcriptional regulator [Myxococcota bacterium]|nr:MarR family transcriptional regulator [Myxococcota bacterium]